jgi:hypothetical protein
VQCHLKNGLTRTENKTVPDTEADSCDLPRYPCNAVSSPRDLGTGESPAEVLVEKIRSKLAQRSPDQSILRKRLPQVIRVNRESIVEHWLQAIKQDPEIGSIPVPDSERKEHVPFLLDVATGAAAGKEFTAEDRKVYVRHGANRYRQGYTVPLLIREARLLQASLADCIQRNFTGIEMNYLVPDTIHFMGTIDALLEDSARGFIQQANAERVSNRRSAKKKLPESNAKAS